VHDALLNGYLVEAALDEEFGPGTISYRPTTPLLINLTTITPHLSFIFTVDYSDTPSSPIPLPHHPHLPSRPHVLLVHILKYLLTYPRTYSSFINYYNFISILISKPLWSYIMSGACCHPRGVLSLPLDQYLRR
jgi:hypothetical protein